MDTLSPALRPPRILAWITNGRVQVLLAVLALCLIVTFGVSVFVFRPYDGMAVLSESGGVVSAMYHPGPAYNAGFQIDDRILTVNGKPIDPWLGRPIYPAGLQAGNIVSFQVERQGVIVDLQLKLGSYLDNLSMLSALMGVLLLAVVFWTIGLLLCLFAPANDIRARLIGLCWLLGGVAAAAGGPGTQSHFWGASATMKASFVVLGFTLVSAHIYFPTQTFSFRQRRFVVNLLAGLAFLFALIVVVEDIVLKPANLSLTALGLPLHRMVYAWFLGLVLACLVLLLRSRIVSHDSEVKRQTVIILWAMALGFGPFFFLTLLPIVIFGDQAPVADGTYTSLFLVLIPLAYAYVIHQRRLLRIDAVLNRLVVFFVLMLGVLLASFAILGTLAIFLRLPPQVAIFGSLSAAAVVVPSALLEKKVQIQVNRILYGTYYDHTIITTSLSSELARAVDRKSLADLLTQVLPAQMGVQQAALYLVEDTVLQQQGVKSGPLQLPLESTFCQALQTSGQPVRAPNLWLLLPEGDRAGLADLEWGQIFTPILFEGDLVGLLILGGRPTGDLYSAQDIAILGTVAHQAALAIANIQLVDSLRGLNRSLVDAEDERRKAIASELHDAVLQDLFFLKHEVAHLEHGEPVLEHLEQLIQRLRATIQKQRPELLNVGLPLALQGLVEEMDRMSGIDGPRIFWHSTLPKEMTCPDPYATSIYRIVQEALTNTRKHAHASQVEVHLDCLPPDGLKLSVQDDGVGMRNSRGGRGNKDSHFGLVMMRERAAMINADLRIESHLNQGTRVELSVKL